MTVKELMRVIYQRQDERRVAGQGPMQEMVLSRVAYARVRDDARQYHGQADGPVLTCCGVTIREMQGDL